MKQQIAVMVEQGGGAIVNTASTVGILAQPNMAAYVASKHGVIGLTKAAAIEYVDKNIRVNGVSNGSLCAIPRWRPNSKVPCR